MTIQTSATDRRTLARAISEHLGAEAVYQGAPGFAYSIGPVTVDRAGSVSGSDADLEALLPFLVERGFVDSGNVPSAVKDAEPETAKSAMGEGTMESDSFDDPAETTEDFEQEKEGEHTEAPDLKAKDAEEGGAEDVHTIELSVPAEGLTVGQMTNIIHMLYAKQYVLNRSCGEEVLHISESVIVHLQEHNPESSEAFEGLLADFEARGDVRGMTLADEKFNMTFPFDPEQPERWQIYALLMTHILEACRRATRIRPNYQETESERYVMYGWLLRLGFGGPDFKEARRYLLKRLKGYCAFANDELAQRHKQKYAELRRIRKTDSGMTDSERAEEGVGGE